MSKYPLYQKTEFEYYFEIEELEGIQYEITYSAASHFLPTRLIDNDIYEMSFTRFGKKKGHPQEISKRIEATIAFSLENFITKFKCPIIFVCDSVDGRHPCRLKLFIRWHKNLEDKEPYSFEVRKINTNESLIYYIGMIIPNDHLQLKELLEELDNPEIFNKGA